MAHKCRSRKSKPSNKTPSAPSKNTSATLSDDVEKLSLTGRPWQVWFPLEIQHRALHEVISSTLQQETKERATGEPNPIDCAAELQTFDSHFEHRVRNIIGPLAEFPHLLEEAKKQPAELMSRVPVLIKFGEGCWEHGEHFDGSILLRLQTSLPVSKQLKYIKHPRIDICTTYPGRLLKQFEYFAESLGTWIEQLRSDDCFPELTSLWISVPPSRYRTKHQSPDNVDQHYLVNELVISMRKLELDKARVLVNATCGGLLTPWKTESKDEPGHVVADHVVGMAPMGDFAIWI